MSAREIVLSVPVLVTRLACVFVIVCTLLVSPARADDAAPSDAPEDVFLKTATESHNRRWYSITRDGHIWVKPNRDRTGEEGPWRMLDLPAGLAGDVIEISSDDENIIAINSAREIWTMEGGLGEIANFRWKKRWGFPFWLGPGLKLTEANRGWAHSYLTPTEDGWYVDPSGHAKFVGLGVTTIYVLGEDGQRITYLDPWLPADESYEMCGPARGRFQARSISASGSTTFLINRFGDMFTRVFDFDMGGGDWVFFGYSYWPQTPVDWWKIYVRQLPAHPWVAHPKIPGAITDRISIFKVGRGAVHRIMRVEGWDADANTGFWEKDIVEPEAAAWSFRRTDEPIQGTALDNKPYDSSGETLGTAEDFAFSRNMEAIEEFGSRPGIDGDDDWAAEITTLNPYCTPTTLRIHTGPGTSFDLVLHTTDDLRTLARPRGFAEEALEMRGTVEIPAAIRDDRDALDPKTRDFIDLYLDDRRFSRVSVSATRDAAYVHGLTPGALTFTADGADPATHADTISVEVDGATPYAAGGELSRGNVKVAGDADGIRAADAAGAVPTAVGGSANVAVHVARLALLPMYTGTIRVRDPHAGIDVRAFVALQGVQPFGHNGARGEAAGFDVASVIPKPVTVEWAVDDVAS